MTERQTTLRKRDRVTHQHDIEEIFADNIRSGSAYLRVLYRPTHSGKQRLGISASRKVGNAVTRNRYKRLIRDFFRLNRDLFPMGDIMIVIGQKASELDNTMFREKLANELNRLQRKAKSS